MSSIHRKTNPRGSANEHSGIAFPAGLSRITWLRHFGGWKGPP